MIPCPGCGAGMRFDIASQRLKCDFCGESANVEDRKAGKTAKQDEWDLTAFVCPQCGGTIYSTENQATSFCFFCGASVTLEGRMTSALRPARIIPFSRTKEECKKIYGDMTRKAFFAPKELRDPAYLERFQGIYLPFWTYRFSQKGPVALSGSRERGEYTEHLRMTCDLDGEYDGISYDASSAFNDELCKCITPYERSHMVDFEEGYTSGFYADVADVDSDVYLLDAENDVNDETEKRLKSQFGMSHFDNMPADRSSLFHTKLEDVTAALYPVWFLTWRSNDRVAYAVVNGETGKMAADLPVDQKRFLMGSLLLALPIFLLLITMPVITAPNLVLIASALSMVTAVIFAASSRQIRRREGRVDDKGFQFRRNRERDRAAGQAGTVRKAEGRRPGEGAADPLGQGLPVLAAVLGIAIRFLAPVSDLYYYGGAVVVLACTCMALLRLVGRFNLLTTRPLPEFHERKDAVI